MAVIESAHFHNFKSLRDVELTGLQRLTVLVGPSGVGKTSVLQGLGLAARLARGVLDEDLLRGRHEPKRLITIGEDQLHLEIRGAGEGLTVNVAREGQPKIGVTRGDTGIAVEFLPGEEGAGIIVRVVDGAEGGPRPSSYVLLAHALRCVLLQLETARLGAPSLTSTSPQIKSDGSGLATVLAYFAGADREVLEHIEAELREILGITGRIRTLPHELEIEERETIRIDEQVLPRTTRRKAAAHRFEIEVDGSGFVTGDALNEGTLVTLGLLTVIHQQGGVLQQPGGTSLVLLDDIDKGLHPDAQARLLATLRALLAKREDLQIICTTHSPYLLDHVAPEEVQVLSFGQGQVVAARLDQHEDWPNWKGKLQTGEFWQSAGESWVKASKRDVG